MGRRDLLVLVTLLATVLPLAGCGGGDPKEPAATTDAGPRSPLDVGPRAGDYPVAVVLAARGEPLFKKKGCAVCHAFGVRLTGPDLRGVTRRRTVQWMERQILHPEIMIWEDPISRDLFAEYNLQMANQGLMADEARVVIEYFKRMDEEAESRGELAAGK